MHHCPLLHFGTFSNFSSVCEILVNWKLLINAPSLFIVLWEFDFVCARAVPSGRDWVSSFIRYHCGHCQYTPSLPKVEKLLVTFLLVQLEELYFGEFHFI